MSLDWILPRDDSVFREQLTTMIRVHADTQSHSMLKCLLPGHDISRRLAAMNCINADIPSHSHEAITSPRVPPSGTHEPPYCKSTTSSSPWAAPARTSCTSPACSEPAAYSPRPCPPARARRPHRRASRRTDTRAPAPPSAPAARGGSRTRCAGRTGRAGSRSR